MGIVLKQASLSSFSSYLGALIGFLNVSLFMNRLFTYEEFGLRSLLLDVTVIIAMLAQFGTGRSLVRFFPFFTAGISKDDKGLFSLTFLVSLLGFVVFAILLIVFQPIISHYFYDKSALIVDYYWSLFPLILLMLINNLFEQKLQANSNTSISTFLREVLNKIVTTFLLVLFYFKVIDFEGFIIGFILSYLLNSLIYYFYLKNTNQLRWKIDWQFFNRKLRKIYFRYSLFTVFTNLSGIVLSKLDIIMLVFLLNLSAVGIYANALYFCILITIPSTSIVKISFPILAHNYKKKRFDLISELYKKTSINQFLVGGVLFTLLWVNIDSVFEFQKEEYATGKMVILILGITRLVDMLTGVNGQIINASKYYPFEGVTSSFLVLIGIGTNFYFIPRYGINGAAFATLISSVSYNVVRVLFIYLKMGLSPFNSQTIKTIAIVLVGIFVGSLLPNVGNNIIDILYKSSIIALLFIFLILKSNVSEDISSLFQKIRSRI
ncbi:lipopolysaccharide biosynthesis protein [Acidiluteibacter ferrifornacis]|uniref:Oligosaccharide flippase family protein n=1 Tax=Acidiluteibacter ferrifornacis TaxID=2692424 RepID=A0A6N9NGT7_9FLAO|nr:oligosaccharide flippase family protein [Acidiluteibacter ferrifornacis]NBG65876.1 oligosaccharide flippase family protein [Acidiluteibacter ferrifornacis]